VGGHRARLAGDLRRHRLQALQVLEQLLDGVLEVLAVDTANGDVVQLASTLVLPHSPGSPLPAFQITTTLDC
jgi:hypothetical protein